MPQDETQNGFSVKSQQPLNAEVYPWYRVWWSVLSLPMTDTFTQILTDPTATAQRGYRWVFSTGAVTMALTMVFNPIMPIGIVPAVLIGTLLGGAIDLINFIVSSWVMQRIALMLGGTGTYGQLNYARAAFMAPLNLLNALLLLLVVAGGDVFSWFGLLLLLFELVLTATALRAVNQFAWGQAMMVTSSFVLLRVLLMSLLGGASVGMIAG